eukprot:SAG11_NODE_11562_length_752_cov_1.537519_1_plen_174_part_01
MLAACETPTVYEPEEQTALDAAVSKYPIKSHVLMRYPKEDWDHRMSDDAKFNIFEHFRQLRATELAKFLPRRLFLTMDLDHDGLLSLHDVRKIYREGLAMKDEQADQWFSELAVGCGKTTALEETTITSDDYIAWFMASKKGRTEVRRIKRASQFMKYWPPIDSDHAVECLVPM